MLTLLSRFLLLGAVFVGTMVPMAVSAADAKVSILGGEIVDAESGQRVNVVLNPSGEAKLTYTTWGLSLSYIGADGKTTALALHADFAEPPPSEDRAVNLRNRLMADMIRAGASLQAGEILTTMAEQMATEGKQVALSLSAKNRVGFVVADYGFGDALVRVDGKPSISLQQIVTNIFTSRVNEQMLAMAAAAAGSSASSTEASAVVAEKKTSAAQGFRKQVCEALFSPPSP